MYKRQHLNPLHDFDGIRLYSLSGSDLEGTTCLELSLDAVKRLFKDLYPIVYFPKHLLRGGFAGGTVGTLVSLASGDSPREGFVVGSSFGVLADSFQFCLRFPYYYRKQILSQPMEQEIRNREPGPNTSN